MQLPWITISPIFSENQQLCSEDIEKEEWGEDEEGRGRGEVLSRAGAYCSWIRSVPS